MEAAWKYIVIVSAGISLALLGTVLFYWAGSIVLGSRYQMTWAVLAGAAPQMNPVLLTLAFLLVLVGYGTKVGLAPMHTWLPDAHSESPAPVSAMLSGALLNTAMIGVAALSRRGAVSPARRPAAARGGRLRRGVASGGRIGDGGKHFHDRAGQNRSPRRARRDRPQSDGDRMRRARDRDRLRRDVPRRTRARTGDLYPRDDVVRAQPRRGRGCRPSRMPTRIISARLRICCAASTFRFMAPI